MLQIKNTLGGGKPEGLYAWKKCKNDTDHTFIDYVVSDKETAYPDKAVHTDGYYYEKVEIDSATCRTGKITLSGNAEVYHNLGEELSFFFMYCSGSFSSYSSFSAAIYRKNSNIYYGEGYQNNAVAYTGSGSPSSGSANNYGCSATNFPLTVTATEESIKLESPNYLGMSFSGTYSWIAIGGI